jgi:secondary thiamine-phosphate synthase enzyme
MEPRWVQRTIRLQARPRGFHLVTAEVLDALPEDDMPAHVKTALLGPSLTLPLSDGRPALGTWQGIYLCEHRDRGGPRSLVATAWGGTR